MEGYAISAFSLTFLVLFDMHLNTKKMVSELGG